ncbi:MAG: filamentous hemagglutinin N-terminal domain-containing protein, partial [Candidatus Omnitrophota bacterium]
MDFWKRILLIAFLVFGFRVDAFANPQGESVVSGAATFDRSAANTLTVNTTSNNTIINYNSFSIAANETTRINQPSAGSAVLNRVVGVDPSSIQGNLSSNGKLFLVNPNGIVFGPGSKVDAPAIVASTLDIANEDFLNGNYKFFKNGANSYIINQGRLASRPGGYIALLSQSVKNEGLILADLGTVALAAGEKVTLALDSRSQISVVVDDAVKSEVLGPDGEKIVSAIDNSGTIQANGGKVILTAKVLNNVFDYAVNNSGLIQAGSLQEHDGVIELVADGAAVANTGLMTANTINIEVSNADFVNKGSLISNLVSGLTNTGNISVLADNIMQAGTVAADSEVTVRAAGAILTDPAVNNDPAVIIQAKRINLIARQFGSVSAALRMEAPLTYIYRTAGDINILHSLGIGTSMLLRGPPDGFGAIIYNQDTNLTLEVPQGSISLAPGVNLTAGNLTLNADNGIINNGSIIVTGTLNLLSNGNVANTG